VSEELYIPAGRSRVKLIEDSDRDLRERRGTELQTLRLGALSLLFHRFTAR
jgi:hypothetical protein